MQATFYCHKPVISFLISAGADPTLTATNGCTALDLATLVDDVQSSLVREVVILKITISWGDNKKNKNSVRTCGSSGYEIFILFFDTFH